MSYYLNLQSILYNLSVPLLHLPKDSHKYTELKHSLEQCIFQPCISLEIVYFVLL